MQVTRYLSCALLMAGLLKVVLAEDAQNKVQEEVFDALRPDDTFKMKRPFCNAFTGCGRKRSFHENVSENQDVESGNTVRLPFTVYKALLKAASQNIRNSIGRNFNDYQMSDIPQVYFSRKVPLE